MSRPDEMLPNDVDVIVLGTGLPESILAAACARVGFTVLHLDRNEYYGGSWSSFNFDGIIQWADQQKIDKSHSATSGEFQRNIQLQDGERLVELNSTNLDNNGPGMIYSNVWFEWHVQPKPQIEPLADYVKEPVVEKPEEPTDTAEITPPVEDLASLQIAEKPEWTQDRIMNDWRRFSLDLAPKILLGRGAMVDLLSHSNVGRYAEFKCVNRLLTFYDGSLKIVPCSRSEVFQSAEISMIEKRMLMKFLTFCLNYDTESERAKWQDFIQTPFAEFLSSHQHQLTDKLRHYILHALAMVSPSTPTSEALKSINEFLMSTGRYGSSPFLWTLYGSGELAQSFCRCCAVFGGIYCLRRSVEAWILDANGNCVGVVTEGQRITCRNLIADGSYIPREILDGRNTGKDTVSRAILVTDKPMCQSDKENVTLLNYYADHLPEPVKILESGAAGCVCPQGLYVIHMSTRGNGHTSAKSDLEPVVKKFFRYDEIQEGTAETTDDRPKVLWSLIFNCTGISLADQLGSNIIIVPPVTGDLTYAGLVPQLQHEFNRLWPNTDFLPPTPNPDDASGETLDGEMNDPGVNGFAPDT